MADDNVTQLNLKVQSNLDEMEREGKGNFFFVLNGKRLELLDPSEIDFKDLMTIEHPANFLKYALSDEAKEVIATTHVPGWKFNQLIEDYMKFYDLDPSRSGKGWLS